MVADDESERVNPDGPVTTISAPSPPPSPVTVITSTPLPVGEGAGLGVGSVDPDESPEQAATSAKHAPRASPASRRQDDEMVLAMGLVDVTGSDDPMPTPVIKWPAV